MNLAYNPSLNADIEAELDALSNDRASKVFLRSISAPAGLPWDQTRAAELDARLGAPLPLADVVYRLRRLEPWRPGRAARFTAFYVRAAEIGDAFVTHVTVDGQAVEVRFLSAAAQSRRMRAASLLLLGVVATVALCGAMVGVAIASRAQAKAQLEQAERLSSTRLRQARKIQRLKAQTVALNAVTGQNQQLEDVIRDLIWTSRAKAPLARVEAWHWDRGYVAVEARGEGEPLLASGRELRRADRPVRRDVWLWGVGAGRPDGGPGTAR
jgi:hypothetical protein